MAQCGAHGLAPARFCNRAPANALLQNSVDGSVRDVFLCSGMGGNVRCRKGSPCSTRAKGSMYPWPARLRLRAAKPPEGSAPRTFSSAPRPPPCRIAMRRGVVAPYAADAACLRRSRLFSTLFYNRANDGALLWNRVWKYPRPRSISLMKSSAESREAGLCRDAPFPVSPQFICGVKLRLQA